MGFALAHQAANLGANVILISGPSAEKVQHSFIKRIDVRSAEDMYQAVHQYYKKAAIVIASAAVADFTPAKINTQKIKKKDGKMQIELVATKDILASLGKEKEKQILVGFALETNNELENAIGKLERKNLDLIVLNSLQDKGAGFANNTNKITLIDRNKKHKEFPLKSKQEVAKDIFSSVLELL
jgi:phosphopantothenoylcysteine decarboxylase/phosphopantothenate--cysteine ligase